MQTLPRIALIAAAVSLAPRAGADEPAEPEFHYVAAYEFARPAELKPDHDLSMKLSEGLLQQQHFGGLPAMVVADANVAGDKWAFYIFDISAADRAAEPEKMIRDTFDELRAGAGEVVSWDEAVDNDMATATMEGRYADTGTVTRMRSQMWVTAAGAPHQLRAECITSEDNAADVRPKCEAAFAALAVKAPDRGSLGPLPTASKPAMQAPATDAGPSGAPSLRPPTNGAVLYNSEPKKTPEKDNTFLYVGGAILLIVAVYMVLRGGSKESSDE